MKKILVYSQYYYPEVASTAQIYKDICEYLVNDFKVTVICSVPCYTGIIEERYKTKRFYFEEKNGVKIIRVRVSDFKKTDKISRIKHILSFFMNSRRATKLTGNQDVVLTYSQPPVLGGMLGVYGKKKTKGKLIYNIQDFNPEQTIAVKYAGNAAVHRIMMMLDMRSCRKSDLVVTVGRDMQETLVNRFNGKDVPKNVVINNWIDENEVYPLPDDNEKVLAFREHYGLSDKLVIMSSGNIGLFYDFENLIKIMAEFREFEDVVFAFVGDGVLKSALQDFVDKNNIKNIIFIPYQDKSELVYSLNAADWHLVCNAKGIKGVSVPSKIYGVLATDKPVIGVLEEGSEAWRIIKESGCGVLARAGEYGEIKALMRTVVERHNMSVNRRTVMNDAFSEMLSRSKSLENIKNEIKKLLFLRVV